MRPDVLPEKEAEVISASLRTELHAALSANSQPKPNDGFVDLHGF
jgi:hypothetical protein